MALEKEKIFKHDIRILEKLPVRKRYSHLELFCDATIIITVAAVGFSFFYISLGEILKLVKGLP